jgi:hypothetical protein
MALGNLTAEMARIELGGIKKSKAEVKVWLRQVESREAVLKAFLNPVVEEVLDANTRKIPLRNKHGVEVGKALVDADDYERLTKVKWHLLNGYALCTTIGSMHRVVMNCKPGDPMVDHIDQNRLNNRKCNLRFATLSQNMANRKKREGCTSKYVGVNVDKGKWRSQIIVDGKYHYLGRFVNEEDAARAVNAKWKELRPGMEVPNDVPDRDDGQTSSSSTKDELLTPPNDYFETNEEVFDESVEESSQPHVPLLNIGEYVINAWKTRVAEVSNQVSVINNEIQLLQRFGSSSSDPTLTSLQYDYSRWTEYLNICRKNLLNVEERYQQSSPDLKDGMSQLRIQ